METDKTAAPGFVAAFSQSSVGDTTPNVLGAWCDDGTGVQCTFEKSLCGPAPGTADACHGRGMLQIYPLSIDFSIGTLRWALRLRAASLRIVHINVLAECLFWFQSWTHSSLSSSL